MELLFLCVAAFFAGLIDAIAGGGGLIQLPALLVFLPPALAADVASVFGTNKMSAIWGTGLAAWQYSKRVTGAFSNVATAGVSAFVFAFLGARTVSLLPPDKLKPLVFALLIVIAGYTFWRKDFGAWHGPRLGRSQTLLLGGAIGAAIGFYDGFFGPGTGSFLIFLFIGVFGFDFLRASASAKIVNFVTNVAAILCFASAGKIYYLFALPMAACNMAGSYLGARLAILKGNQFVRGFFLIVAGGLILRLGWELFGR